MKKIGILYGMEQSFPFALSENINSRKIRGLASEFLCTGNVRINEIIDYHVIFDRVSHEVPFFRSVLKKAYIDGTNVINNPFNCCSIDNFFNAGLGEILGIKVPKTAIIPTKHHPPGTSAEAMKNLMYPLNWDELIEYIGFPAFIKPNLGVTGNSAYKVYNSHEFFAAYDFTGSKIMVMQESIEYDDYYRCYVIGGSQVRIIRYDPAKPYHLRYSREQSNIDPKLKTELEKVCLKISNSLGFSFNAVDFAINKGIPYTIDFLNPVPKIEKAYMSEEDFTYLVNTTADFLIESAAAKPLKFKNYKLAEFISGYDNGNKSEPKTRKKTKEIK